MLNLQVPEKPVPLQDLGDSLEVFKIFKTIQGEGPYAGHVSIFVRLSGCNLDCPFCDTDYTSIRNRLSPREILDQAAALGFGRTRLIVLTGGEPFRQNVALLAMLAQERNVQVQIETNGTLYSPAVLYSNISVVCSPKTGSVNRTLERHISAYKYILQAGQVAEDGLPLSTMGFECSPARPQNRETPVYVQPLDEQDMHKNRANMDAAVASCLKHGYLLSLQLHKIAGLE